jgi:hypothetical protein
MDIVEATRLPGMGQQIRFREISERLFQSCLDCSVREGAGALGWSYEFHALSL